MSINNIIYQDEITFFEGLGFKYTDLGSAIRFSKNENGKTITFQIDQYMSHKTFKLRGPKENKDFNSFEDAKQFFEKTKVIYKVEISYLVFNEFDHTDSKRIKHTFQMINRNDLAKAIKKYGENHELEPELLKCLFDDLIRFGENQVSFKTNKNNPIRLDFSIK